jgi:hypothetical protein
MGNSQMALFAAFGGFATLVFAAFGGTRNDKLIAHVALAIAGVVDGGKLSATGAAASSVSGTMSRARSGH